MIKNTLTSFTLLLFLASIILYGCKDDDASDTEPSYYLSLGVILPLDQEKGELRKNALLTAINEINANSGVGNGYEIKLVIKSSEGADRENCSCKCC